MAVPIVQKPAQPGKENAMQALCNSHMIVHEMGPKQFFRTAYMWKFGKDITDLSLANDAKLFDEQGKVPPYAVDYLIHCYGCQ